jgi:hypothetical protein
VAREILHQPLPFRYLSTGAITRFTDTRDPQLDFKDASIGARA